MRIVIAAGGTGGHLFPGIAVAEALKQKDPAGEILFVGSERELEENILGRYKFRHEVLSVGRIKGVGVIDRIKTVARLPMAVWRAGKILSRFGADAVLGVGGHSSGPVILSACLQRIPTAFLEPNAIPGFTNRLLAPFVDRIFVAFPEAERFFRRKKTHLTGTPIRAGLSSDKKSGGPFSVLILGGSQGASSLNQAVVAALPILERSGREVRIFHQTGERDFEKVRTAYRACPFVHEVFPFSSEMGRVYREADLVLCRAGASTVAELVKTGSPAIFVPYPHAADDHQRWNALSVVEAGGGELLPDSQLDGAIVAEKILHYERDREGLQEMRRALLSQVRRPASEVIAEECLRLGRRQ